jgi:hypothetical protein
MQTRSLLHTLLAFAVLSPATACREDETPSDDVGATEGDGDGDPTGDGDGDPTGDGDGDPTGDGDGDPTGDGDGDPTGDGDGDATGDGDGDDQAAQCQQLADAITQDLSVDDGGCAIIVRFDYETLSPTAWSHQCGSFSEGILDADEARMLGDCCSDGERLAPDDDALFTLFSQPDADAETDGGVKVISHHLAALVLEATIGREGQAGDLQHPGEWSTPENLGSGCEGSAPSGTGYDLTMNGEELADGRRDDVMAAFADTALAQAIHDSGTVESAMTLAYPRTLAAFEPSEAEYLLVLLVDTRDDDDDE